MPLKFLVGKSCKDETFLASHTVNAEPYGLKNVGEKKKCVFKVKFRHEISETTLRTSIVYPLRALVTGKENKSVIFTVNISVRVGLD